jgi:hypothetical protein
LNAFSKFSIYTLENQKLKTIYKICDHAQSGNHGCGVAVPHYLPARAITKAMPTLPTRVVELACPRWHLPLVLCHDWPQAHPEKSQHFSAQDRMGYVYRLPNRSHFRFGPANHPLAATSRGRDSRFKRLGGADFPPHRRMNQRTNN